ncbi:unnamed protein product, partial [Symbiodinium pilosum]
ARSLVSRPGAALARIRCDFFAEMAASWATVATDLGARQRSLKVRSHAPRPAEGFGSGGVVVSSAPPAAASPAAKEVTPASRPKDTQQEAPSRSVSAHLQTPLAAQLLRSVSTPEAVSPQSGEEDSEGTAQDADPGLKLELSQSSFKASASEPGVAAGEDSPMHNEDELRKLMSLIAAENGGNVEAVLQDHIAKPDKAGHRTADDKLYASMAADDGTEDFDGEASPEELPANSEEAHKEEVSASVAEEAHKEEAPNPVAQVLSGNYAEILQVHEENVEEAHKEEVSASVAEEAHKEEAPNSVAQEATSPAECAVVEVPKEEVFVTLDAEVSKPDKISAEEQETAPSMAPAEAE